MTKKEYFEKNLEFNLDLAEKLKTFFDRKVSELPDNLKKELQKIEIGPTITSSGLEDVKTILKSLEIYEIVLRDAIKNPENFMDIYSGEKQPTGSTHSVNSVQASSPQATPVAEPSVRNGVKPTTNNRQQTIDDRKQKSETNRIEANNNINIKSTPKITIKPASDIPPPSSQIEL